MALYGCLAHFAVDEETFFQRGCSFGALEPAGELQQGGPCGSAAILHIGGAFQRRHQRGRLGLGAGQGRSGRLQMVVPVAVVHGLVGE